MKINLLPKKSTDKSHSISTALKGSHVLSSCFLLVLDNKKVDTKEVAKVLGKSNAQVYQVYERLNHFGVVIKVPRKCIFALTEKFNKETFDLFKKDALERVGNEGE